MCNQYEARKIFFNYACVKICIMGYMTSPCCDEWNRRFLLQNTLAQGYTRLRIPIYFIFIFNKIHFNLYLLRKSFSLF